MPRSTQKLTGYSPFIPSQHNFLDPKANSKSLQSKYPHIRFTDNSHNITALAQQAKSVAFANNMAFPSAVMGGTLPPPHTTTFAKDSPYDISDVLRYTFHDRPRQTVYDQTLKNNKQT